MSNICDQTFRNYEDAITRAFAAEYDLSLSEARELNLTDIRREWFDACFEFARASILRWQVLDCMTERERYRIFHDIPCYLRRHADAGSPYVSPDAKIRIAAEAR